MKRRNFLKSALSSIIIGPSTLKTIVQNKPVKLKKLDTYVTPEECEAYMNEEPRAWIGLLSHGNEVVHLGLANNKGYCRIKSPKKWELKIDGTIINTEEVYFPQALKNWGIITEFAFFDAKEGGNMLLFGKSKRKRSVVPGDTVSFPSQCIKVTL